MKKKYFDIPLYVMLIPFAVYLIGIIFGSFFDWNISVAIADVDSPFGNAMETVGYMICYAIIPIGGILTCLGLIKRKNNWIKALGVFIYALSLGIMIYMLGNALSPDEHGYGVTMAPALAYTVAAALGILASLLFYFIVDRNNQGMLLRLGLIILAAIILEVLFINVTKYLNCRPRFRYLTSDYNTTGEVFRQWWDFKPFQFNDDFHKSWPSGHTAFSGHLMLLSFVTPLYIRHNKATAPILFALAFCFNITVGISRILCGAHFLSDISFGGLFSWTITVILILIGNHFFHPENKKVNALTNELETR